MFDPPLESFDKTIDSLLKKIFETLQTIPTLDLSLQHRKFYLEMFSPVELEEPVVKGLFQDVIGTIENNTQMCEAFRKRLGFYEELLGIDRDRQFHSLKGKKLLIYQIVIKLDSMPEFVNELKKLENLVRKIPETIQNITAFGIYEINSVDIR